MGKSPVRGSRDVGKVDSLCGRCNDEQIAALAMATYSKGNDRQVTGTQAFTASDGDDRRRRQTTISNNEGHAGIKAQRNEVDGQRQEAGMLK